MAAERFDDVFEEGINTMKGNVVSKGTRDATKTGLTFFESMI